MDNKLIESALQLTGKTMVNKTTMTFIGYGKWRCDSCGTEYSGYTTRCIDGCKKENITDGKSNLKSN